MTGTVRLEVRPRRGGKTAQMVRWMREAPVSENRVCVCISRDEVRRLQQDNPDLQSWQFVTVDEVTRGRLRGAGGRIVLGVDNLDLLLRQVFNEDVGFATWTTGWPT